MQDILNLILLAGAIAASLFFGVAAAHVICRAAFTALRLHASSVAEGRQLAKASVTS